MIISAYLSVLIAFNGDLCHADAMDELREQTDLLRAARVLAGLTQDDLAAAAGISRQKLVRMERGDENVSVAVMVAVRTALEQCGIIFTASSKNVGPGIARRRHHSIDLQSRHSA